MDIQPVTKIWRTGKGDLVRICDMDDSHLGNVIAWMEKRAIQKGLRTDNEGKFYIEEMPSAYPFLMLEQERRYYLELDRKDEFKEKLRRRLKGRKPDPLKARTPIGKSKRKPKRPEGQKKPKNKKLQRGLEL